MKTRFLWLMIFVVVILFGFERANACSCIRRETPAKAFVKAKTILVGTTSKLSIVKDKSGFYDLRATFQAEEVLKGKLEEKIDVFTSSQGTACGYRFEENGRYLIYAYEDTETKQLETSICVRTRPLPLGMLDDELEILRSLSRGKLEPRIYGVVYELTRGIYPLRQDYWSGRKPMPGLKVIAKKGSKTLESISDANGRFSIVGLKKGKYRLEFIVPEGFKLGGDYWDEPTKEDRKQYENIELEITENDSPDILTIETRIDGRIKGKVIDEKGNAAGKDTMVSLISRETAEKEVGDIDYVHAYTDSNGNFDFFGIPQGEYYLGFNLESKPSKNFPYPRTYFPFTTEIEKAKIIVLERAETLDGFILSLPIKVEEIEVKGKVTDANGNPVKGAIVERYGLYYGEWREDEPYSMKSIKQPTFEGRIETNENGEFTLKVLKGNKYRLNPFLESKGSYKDLLKGDEIDIEANENLKPIVLVLDRKPK